MTLSAYMDSRSLTAAEMAKLIGCSIGAIRKWRYGDRIPCTELLIRIMKVTEGKVCPDDFIFQDRREEASA
jgi:transcriptional regulator with XRE-family HTH domain